jgi:hypothetical protein
MRDMKIPLTQRACSRFLRRVAITSCSWLAVSAACGADFTVTAVSTAFNFTINGTPGSPTLTLVRGRTYTFAVNTHSSHRFRISGPGVVNNDIFQGTVTYTVPTNAQNRTYICPNHGFGGSIITIPPPVPPPIRIVWFSINTNVVLRSTGTNTLTLIPEFKTNFNATNWFALSVQTNRFSNGTNETICGRPPGGSVFIRIRAR